MLLRVATQESRLNGWMGVRAVGSADGCDPKLLNLSGGRVRRGLERLQEDQGGFGQARDDTSAQVCRCGSLFIVFLRFRFASTRIAGERTAT